MTNANELLTGRTRLPGFGGPWSTHPFPEVMMRVNVKKHQVPASLYGAVGTVPVVDQGQKAIVGYTDNTAAMFDPGADGAVVFGDHTCITKFVDFPFAVGADGTQVVKAIRPNVTRFLAYVLENNPVESTGYNRHFGFLREKYFMTPPREEQLAIAMVLNDADDLISALERLITKKQAIKRGMMQELLTGRTRLPGYSGSWSKTTLGSLGTFLRGRGIKRDDVRSTGAGCIRYGELYTTFNDYTDKTRSFVSPAVAATALPLRTGDLLFAGSGETRDEIGKCVAYIGESSVAAGGDVIVLRGDQYNAVYLALLANTPEVVAQKARAGQGDAVVHIYSHALAAIEVDMPSRAEQDAVARLILDVDRELDLLRQRLAKARAIKQGMMQELLTGRTRLPVEEAVA